MADFITALLAFPPEAGIKVSVKEYDKQIKLYLQDLNKVQPALWISPVDKRDLLDLLDPSTHSLPYLFALNQRIKVAGEDEKATEQLLTRIYKFLGSFDPIQIRYEGSQWFLLLDTILRMYEAQGTQDMSSVICAMMRLDPTAGTFTQFHLRMLKLCIITGLPSKALSILDQDIYAFPQIANKGAPEDMLNENADFSNSYIKVASGFTPKISAEHVLEYYLLGGSVYLALSNFRRARLFFEYVMLTPTWQHAVSALQLEAFKKWILAGLLSEGKTFPLPKTLDASALKSLQTIGKAYETLAETFSRRDWKKFQAEVEKGLEMWSNDGNACLVKKVSDALLHFRVLDLRKTYVALPISKVSSLLDMPLTDVLGLLADMRSRGILQADISGSGADAALRFHLNDVGLRKSSAEESLEAQTARFQALTAYIRDASRRLQISKEYVDHQKREKKAAGPDGDIADAMDLTYDAPVMVDDDMDDEDIMR